MTEVIDTLSKYGHWVTKIDIASNFGPFETDELQTLFSYTPNLEELDFRSESNDIEFYLEHLRDMDNKMLKKLVKIEVDSSMFALNGLERYWRLIFSAQLNFCYSLTSLCVFYCNEMYTFNGISGDFFQSLRLFENFTHLKLYNMENADVTLFQVQEMLPNLVSFKHDSRDFPLPDDQYVKTVLQRMKQASPTSELSFYSRNLRSLELDLFTLTKPYVQYFTSNLPTHLDHISIKLIDTNFCDLFEDIGVDLIIKFAKRLGEIKTVDLTTDSLDLAGILDDDGERVQRAPEARMTLFYTFLNAFIGNRDLSDCTFKYAMEPLASEKYIELANNCLYIDYILERRLEGSADYQIPLPDRNKSIIGPVIINTLELPMHSNDVIIPNNILQFGFDNCPRLRHFQIVVKENRDYDAAKVSFYASGAGRSRTANRRFATPTSCNLTEVNMGGFPLTQEIVDVLSMYLPNLQKLTRLTHKTLDDNVENIVTINSLGLTNLRNLNFFQYNIGIAMLGNFDHLFICFSYPNQGQELYFDVIPIGDDKFVSSPTVNAFIQQFMEMYHLQ